MEIQNIPLRLIAPSPRNPRKSFDDDALRELADNIRQQGLLQPITVRPVDWDDNLDEEIGEIVSTPTKYEIVCGERRFRAFSLIDADSKRPLTIPALVRDMSDDEAFDAMITENLQRKDVDPIEEAIAFRELVKAGQDCKSIAVRFGKSERYVQDRMKLAALTDKAVEALREERITLAGALMLAKLDEKRQNEVITKLPDTGATTAAMKTAIQRMMCSLVDVPFDLNKNYDGCATSCNKCEHNTANHGCLFYEMKNDAAKCTKRECFLKKVEAYASAFACEHKDELVKVNENMLCGKALIVVSNEGMDEETRNFKKYVHNEAKTSGFKVSLPFGEELTGRCYYAIDDERTKKGLADHTIVLGWTLDGFSKATLHWRLYPYKVNVKETDDYEDDTLTENEVERRRVYNELQELRKEYKEELVDELMTEADGWDFDSNHAMEDVELTAILRLLVYSSDNETEVVEAVTGEEYANYYEARRAFMKLTDEDVLKKKNAILRVIASEKITRRFMLEGTSEPRELAEKYYRAASPDVAELFDNIHDEYKPQIEELEDRLSQLEAE